VVRFITIRVRVSGWPFRGEYACPLQTWLARIKQSGYGYVVGLLGYALMGLILFRPVVTGYFSGSLPSFFLNTEWLVGGKRSA